MLAGVTRGQLAIVVPCFNERDALPATCRELRSILGSMVKSGLVSESSFVLLVDDGSSDSTWNVIQDIRAESPECARTVAAIRLAHNAGHQPALLAGMECAVATADVVVTIDADLQDDPHVIPEMVQRCAEGADVVLGVRRSRDSDTWFKRTSARSFYRLMNLLGVRAVPDHADFRAMSRVAVQRLLRFPERNLFLRAVVPTLSSRLAVVHYNRATRTAGESKYTLIKMASFAWRGITANSTTPLRAVFVAGLASLVLSVVGVAYAMIGWLDGRTVPGWLSLAIPQFLIGGMIMLSQAVFGEYLARIYVETKRRPHFFVAEAVGPITLKGAGDAPRHLGDS